MKQNKLVYQAPEAEIFEVKSEGYLCASPNSVRGNSSSSGYDDDEDLGGLS